MRAYVATTGPHGITLLAGFHQPRFPGRAWSPQRSGDQPSRIAHDKAAAVALESRNMDLTVTTWNIGGCLVDVGDDEKQDIGYFVEALSLAAADFVFLQEVHVFDDARENQAAIIGRKLGYPHVYVHAGSRSHLADDAQLALAVLTRHPIDSIEYSILPTPELEAQKGEKTWRLFPKGVLLGTARIAGAELAWMCAHTHPFHHFDRDALEPDLAASWHFLDRRLAALADRELIAGIDLNDPRFEALLPRSLAGGVANAFVAPTIPRGVQQDYVMFAGNRLSAIDWSVTPTRADHHLCTARFDFGI